MAGLLENFAGTLNNYYYLVFIWVMGTPLLFRKNKIYLLVIEETPPQVTVSSSTPYPHLLVKCSVVATMKYMYNQISHFLPCASLTNKT